MRIVVETKRLLLRPFTEGDAGPLAALYGDPRVMRFITPQPPSLAEVESKILPEYLLEYRELGDGLGSFAAIEKNSGLMAGSLSLKPANSYGLTGGTELGYRLTGCLGALLPACLRRSSGGCGIRTHEDASTP